MTVNNQGKLHKLLRNKKKHNNAKKKKGVRKFKELISNVFWYYTKEN